MCRKVFQIKKLLSQFFSATINIQKCEIELKTDFILYKNACFFGPSVVDFGVKWNLGG